MIPQELVEGVCLCCGAEGLFEGENEWICDDCRDKITVEITCDECNGKGHIGLTCCPYCNADNNR